MRVISTKSKNAESFYISKGYVNDNGVSTSVIVRKLGTLEELLKEHGPTRDDVMAWAKEEARLETQKYKEEKKNKIVQIMFHADRQLDYGRQRVYRGGYLFLQSIYYELQLVKICRKLRYKYKKTFDCDINAILSDLIYARVLEPYSNQPSFNVIRDFIEKPLYRPEDICTALELLGRESDYIQAEINENNRFSERENIKVLYYSCTNYCFEIKEKDKKGKEFQPGSIIQMGLLMNSEGLPLAFSLMTEDDKGHTDMKQSAEEMLRKFNNSKITYCGTEKDEPQYAQAGKKSYIAVKPVKELSSEYRKWAIYKKGYKRVSDDLETEINYNSILPNDKTVYYKEEPYTLEKPHHRLIIVYSPKYAIHQKILREKQALCAESVAEGSDSYNNGHYEEGNNESTAKYDGLYAVYTDLINEKADKIIKICENRWQTESCFRIVKTDFPTRLAYLQNGNCIKGHFLVCCLALLIYRTLDKKLGYKYTGEEILAALNSVNFAGIEEQGFMPLYKREKIIDDLHEACGFRTDLQFITKSGMKTIQKNSKGNK